MAEVEKVVEQLDKLNKCMTVAYVLGDSHLDVEKSQFCISEAIQTIRELQENLDKYHAMGYREGAKDMEKAKQVIIDKLQEQIPKWHLCSEELPKTTNYFTTFLVATEKGEVLAMEWVNTTVRGKAVSRWMWRDRISPWKVIAWMELPKLES